jgi:hypothetical protein
MTLGVGFVGASPGKLDPPSEVPPDQEKAER